MRRRRMGGGGGWGGKEKGSNGSQIFIQCKYIFKSDNSQTRPCLVTI